jgi:2-methylisocitrate lyase-like PEP mutase family enzyme
MTEMIENARLIVEAVDLPVIADADTGAPLSSLRRLRAAGRAPVPPTSQGAPSRHRRNVS